MPAKKITTANRQQRMLRAARMMRGYTQANMAKKLGVTQSAYSDMESNLRNVKFGRVCDICYLLGINVADIVAAERR